MLQYLALPYSLLKLGGPAALLLLPDVNTALGEVKRRRRVFYQKTVIPSGVGTFAVFRCLRIRILNAVQPVP